MKTIFFKDRFLAFLIDSIVISLIVGFLSGIFNLDDFTIGKYSFFGLVWKVKYSVNFFVALIYFLLIDVFSNGKSLGKRIFGLTVVPERGENSTIQTKVARTLFKTTSLYTFFLIPVILIYYLIKNDIVYDAFLKLKTIKNSKS